MTANDTSIDARAGADGTACESSGPVRFHGVVLQWIRSTEQRRLDPNDSDERTFRIPSIYGDRSNNLYYHGLYHALGPH